MSYTLHKLPISLKVVVKNEQICRTYLEKGEGEIEFIGAVSATLKKKLTTFWESYLLKQPIELDLSLDLTYLPPFTKKILQFLQTVSFGEKTTYKELAEMAGHPKAARAVGTACGKNPFPLLIPCHRCIAKNHLGGFAFPLEIKKNLLDHEISR